MRSVCSKEENISLKMPSINTDADEEINSNCSDDSSDEIKPDSLDHLHQYAKRTGLSTIALALFSYLFYDEYRFVINAKDSNSEDAYEHTKYYITCTFSLIAINLIIELVLEQLLKRRIPPQTCKLYPVTCAIRGILNNIAVIFLYIYADFEVECFHHLSDKSSEFLSYLVLVGAIDTEFIFDRFDCFGSSNKILYKIMENAYDCPSFVCWCPVHCVQSHDHSLCGAHFIYYHAIFEQ